MTALAPLLSTLGMDLPIARFMVLGASPFSYSCFLLIKKHVVSSSSPICCNINNQAACWAWRQRRL
jgi:hypothetical protein